MCSHDAGKIRKAYKAGTAIVGFHLVGSVAWGFEDRIMAQQHIAALNKHTGIAWEDQMDDGNYLDHDVFCEIYKAIVGLGNGDIRWGNADIDEIQIGGYGLFSS